MSPLCAHDYHERDGNPRRAVSRHHLGHLRRVLRRAAGADMVASRENDGAQSGMSDEQKVIVILAALIVLFLAWIKSGE